MESSAVLKQEQITYPDLPLAIYREIASHLQQVNGTQTHLITQDSSTFSYTQSQVKALVVQYSSTVREQIDMILNFYASRYGAYQRLETSN